MTVRARRRRPRAGHSLTLGPLRSGGGSLMWMVRNSTMHRAGIGAAEEGVEGAAEEFGSGGVEVGGK
jgi:hypothetical protein